MFEHALVWIDTLASLLIMLSVLRLYEVHRNSICRKGRVFLASIGAAALSSGIEILAWNQPLPLGLTAFIVLLAVLWALRAFLPELMQDVVPSNTGGMAVAGMMRPTTRDSDMAQAMRDYPARRRAGG